MTASLRGLPACNRRLVGYRDLRTILGELSRHVRSTQRLARSDSILAEKLRVADAGNACFEILGDLLVICCQTAEHVL